MKAGDEDMINIAICEDDIVFRKLIYNEMNRFLNAIGIDGQIKSYSNGQDLLQQKNIYNFDIYLFDIEIGEDDGIDMAKQIRINDNNAIFIFITNKNERVYEVFNLDTFGFVRKSNLKKELPVLMSRLKEKLSGYINKYQIKCENGNRYITLNEIYYIERVSGNIYIHTKEENITTRYRYMTELPFEIINDVMKEVYRGIVVNFNHISHINNNDIIMTNGEKVPISRRKKTKIKDDYREFMFR